MIFDGRAFAKETEEKLRVEVEKLAKKIKIVSLVVGNDPASELYSRLKQKAAERVGIEFEISRIEIGLSVDQMKVRIKEVAAKNDVTGVMIQLPIAGIQGKELDELLSEIPLRKDVDGLRWRESGVVPATVRAVLSLVDMLASDKRKFVVLGSSGAVGSPLVHFLRKRGVEVDEIEWDTKNPELIIKNDEVVISCVGQAGLVTDSMITSGSIVIDVGMSEVEGKIVGDMTQEVYQKASMVVPVPGGVGPNTIASLLLNAYDLESKN